ncbi:hypothetical protein AX16_009401 [Volvariella volvacea WC 439]|nr:hypothetical protein AX16_009401 [Volvariella volvacea WC 439]
MTICTSKPIFAGAVTNSGFISSNNHSSPAATVSISTLSQTTLATSEDNLNNDKASADTSTMAQQESDKRSFHIFAEHEIAHITEDEDKNKSETSPEATSTGTFTYTPISQLFNFGNKAWVERHACILLTSFEEELALFELLDLDAEGDNDVDIPVDNTTGDMLVG